MLLNVSESQLVTIDTTLADAKTQQHIRALVQIARLCKVPVTEHVLGSHFDACAEGLADLLREIGTPKASPNARSLPKHLQKEPTNQRPNIVLVGFATHVSVLQTALSLLEEELDVWLVTNACSSINQFDKDAALDRLAGAGAELVTLEMVAFEWLESPDHPQYDSVQALLMPLHSLN